MPLTPSQCNIILQGIRVLFIEGLYHLLSTILLPLSVLGHKARVKRNFWLCSGHGAGGPGQRPRIALCQLQGKPRLAPLPSLCCHAFPPSYSVEGFAPYYMIKGLALLMQGVIFAYCIRSFPSASH